MVCIPPMVLQSFHLWRDPRSPGDTGYSRERCLPALTHVKPSPMWMGLLASPMPLEQAPRGVFLQYPPFKISSTLTFCDPSRSVVQTRTWPPVHHSGGKQSVIPLCFGLCDICLGDEMKMLALKPSEQDSLCPFEKILVSIKEPRGSWRPPP